MIDAAQIEHLANLARLKLTTEEKITMQEDLSKVLGYFQQLGEIDTSGVEEMQRPINLVNVLREDVASEPFDESVIAALASEMHEGQIKVPRTVETD